MHLYGEKTERGKIMKCEWCGRTDELLEPAIDNNGNELELCVKCRKALSIDVCRTCGVDISNGVTLKGLCERCLQISAYMEFEKEQEEISELECEINKDVRTGTPLTEKDCEEWRERVTKDINPEMLKRDGIAQHIVAVSMFISAGIKDNNIISANTRDLMYIIKNETDKILYKKTELHIAGSPEEDEVISKGKIAASKGNVYILEV